MPCVCHTADALSRIAKEALDDQTDRLCRLCAVVEEGHGEDLIEEAGLTEWWTKHKIDDAKRKQNG